MLLEYSHMRTLKSSLLTLGICTGAVIASSALRLPSVYDSARETTIRGTVQEVRLVEWAGFKGMHLVVKTTDRTVEAALGPIRFIQMRGFNFEPGDSVQITGATVEVNGAALLIAREVTSKGHTLKLRDKDGAPLWMNDAMRERLLHRTTN